MELLFNMDSIKEDERIFSVKFYKEEKSGDNLMDVH